MHPLISASVLRGQPSGLPCPGLDVVPPPGRPAADLPAGLWEPDIPGPPFVEGGASYPEPLRNLDDPNRFHRCHCTQSVDSPFRVSTQYGHYKRWPRRCANSPGPGHDGGTRHDES
jgi:hypothetical protein